jgi:hypothetical protein
MFFSNIGRLLALGFCRGGAAVVVALPYVLRRTKFFNGIAARAYLRKGQAPVQTLGRLNRFRARTDA